MNHSKTRFVLPLVALCVLLVGAQAAFGQATLTLGSNPTRLRSEGITEASGAITFSNPTGVGQIIPGSTTVTVVFDVPITSPSTLVVGMTAADSSAIANIYVSTAAASASICTAALTPVASCTAGPVQTTSTIQFVIGSTTPLTIPPGQSLNITGIRLNASAVAAGSAILATVTTTPPNAITFPAGGNQTVVGRTQPTLGPVTLTALAAAAGTGAGGGGVSLVAGAAVADTTAGAPPAYVRGAIAGATVKGAAGYTSAGLALTQCALQSSSTGTTATTFNVGAAAGSIPLAAVGIGVVVSEPSNFPGAFTTAADEQFLTPVPIVTAIPGGVTKGIELTFNYTGLVAGTTLFVPNVLSNLVTGAAAATATESWVLLTNPGTTTSAAVAAITGQDITGFAASAAGAVTIGYLLNANTAASPTSVESVTFPVVFSVTAGTPVALGSFGSVSVSVGRVDTSATSTTRIRFAANASPAVASLFNVTPCSTNLLFPYITSTGGFVTAVAIANTNADGPAAGGGIGTALGLPGGVTLRFWGTGVPAAAAAGAGVALAIPAVSTSGTVATAGVIAPGEYTVFLSTDVAPGFTGYMIATCNFLYAHGFALITNGFGTPGQPVSGTYLPLVVPKPRVAASIAAPEVLAH